MKLWNFYIPCIRARNNISILLRSLCNRNLKYIRWWGNSRVQLSWLEWMIIFRAFVFKTRGADDGSKKNTAKDPWNWNKQKRFFITWQQGKCALAALARLADDWDVADCGGEKPLFFSVATSLTNCAFCCRQLAENIYIYFVRRQLNTNEIFRNFRARCISMRMTYFSLSIN